MKKKTLYWLIPLLVIAIGVLLFFVLRPYFQGQKIPNPEVFRIGNFSIRWYGLLIALAFIPGLYIAYHMAENWSLNPDHIFNLIIICAPLGLIFARLIYCFLNWSYYSRFPIQILYIWQGGLSLYGALLGGLLGILIYTALTKLNFLLIMDIFSVPAILGQAIGRWGNFFNQELFGYPTDLPWKLYISPEHRPNQYMGFNYFHPTFLYESIYNLILFGVLFSISRRKDLKAGYITSLYFIGYGVFRFLLEFVRIEPQQVWLMSWGQVASLVMVILGAIILYFVHVKGKPVIAVTQPMQELEKGQEMPLSEPSQTGEAIPGKEEKDVAELGEEKEEKTEES